MQLDDDDIDDDTDDDNDILLGFSITTNALWVLCNTNLRLVTISAPIKYGFFRLETNEAFLCCQPSAGEVSSINNRGLH
jgi:hypothetical protein